MADADADADAGLRRKTNPTHTRILAVALCCRTGEERTFMCRFVGRRYWPNVITSTPVFARSLIVCRISAAAQWSNVSTHYRVRSVVWAHSLCGELMERHRGRSIRTVALQRL